MPLFPNAEPVERQTFLAGFRRSRRGNLYRALPDGVAVVFRYKSGSKAGQFGWLVKCDDWEAHFSPCGYTRRRLALELLAAEMGY
jgi:hypothetical protein